jgi:hypothetical protein
VLFGPNTRLSFAGTGAGAGSGSVQVVAKDPLGTVWTPFPLVQAGAVNVTVSVADGNGFP